MKGLIMNNFDRYLSDINPEMLEDIARKRRFKTLISDIIGGFILFGMLGVCSLFGVALCRIMIKLMAVSKMALTG